jgi:hypothetical protein
MISIQDLFTGTSSVVHRLSAGAVGMQDPSWFVCTCGESFLLMKINVPF